MDGGVRPLNTELIELAESEFSETSLDLIGVVDVDLIFYKTCF